MPLASLDHGGKAVGGEVGPVGWPLEEEVAVVVEVDD